MKKYTYKRCAICKKKRRVRLEFESVSFTCWPCYREEILKSLR